MNEVKNTVSRFSLHTFFQTFVSVFLILLSLILLIPESYFMSDTATAPLALEDRILRLHILAAGDDSASQELKLHVRDAVLSHLRSTVSVADTATEAEQLLLPQLNDIVSVANQVLEHAGVSYRATASVTTEFFPIKQYGSLLLPPGQYRALRIVLGEGEGKNWWCMLYPSLCFTEGITATIPDDEKEELKGLLSEEEFDLLFSEKEKKPKFCFRLLELWKKLWNRD